MNLKTMFLSNILYFAGGICFNTLSRQASDINECFVILIEAAYAYIHSMCFSLTSKQPTEHPIHQPYPSKYQTSKYRQENPDFPLSLPALKSS